MIWSGTSTAPSATCARPDDTRPRSPGSTALGAGDDPLERAPGRPPIGEEGAQQHQLDGFAGQADDVLEATDTVLDE